MTEKHDELIEFRLTKLEDAFALLTTNLGVLREIVVKWDSRISASDGFLQCPIHKEKMDQFEKRLNKLEGIVEELHKFKWKAVGVLSAVILLINIFSPLVLDYIKDHGHSTPVQVQDAVAGFNLDLSRMSNTNR